MLSLCPGAHEVHTAQPLKIERRRKPMPQISLRKLTFTYSSPVLLDGITLNIERGEKVGLVGRNGAGKSTLLKLISGELKPDDGEIEILAESVLARLSQDVPDGVARTVFEVAADGFDLPAGSVASWRRLGLRMSAGEELSGPEAEEYERASVILADAEQWQAADHLESLLQEMDLPADAEFQSLSAGMKRRVLLAAAMIRRPDILLLDEPTNHLDIESILWLQDFLQRYEGTLIFITHDRVFLQETATRIVEVERGRIFDWTCDYQTFLQRRDALLAAEAAAEAEFDRRLSEEEAWIRKGIKARRTRNEGRVRALKAMRVQRADRRKKQGSARMQMQQAERSGNLVAELEDVSHAFGERLILQGFSTQVMRGDRVGIIGPNGIGKSTLLRILLGQLQPDSGRVRLGTNQRVAYFDQLRSQLDETKTARENIADGNDFLEINGVRKHVMGYLQDFLFSPDRAHQRTSFLSGGERNRLLLAKMMSKPSNVMVLDEPTNDLDSETLELLEEMLPEYQGTVFLVSHDRAFLNNVVTSTIVFEGIGTVGEYDGGYDDWLRVFRQRQESDSAMKSAAKKESETRVTTKPVAEKQKRRVRLSYRDQRELEQLPDRIAELETRQTQLQSEMAAPGFYQSGQEQVAKITAQLTQVSDDLLQAFERWEELESLSG